MPLRYALCWVNPGISPLLYRTKQRGKTKHFSKDFQKVGAGFWLWNRTAPVGKIKAGHKRLPHVRQRICQLCGKLLRPAIWWFHITTLGSNVPRCSVTTKSFIRRFLGSFSCNNILANNRSLVNMFYTDFSSSHPRTHFGASEDCELRTAKGAN